MSKARAKGTAGENFFLSHLRDVFGEQVERAPLKGTLDYGDFTGVPWLHESKNTQKPLVQQWIRTCKNKAGDRPWALMWKGDMRTIDGEAIVVIPLALYLSLVETWNDRENDGH